MDACFEISKPLRQKTAATRTLFDDLLQSSETRENSHSGTTSLQDQHQQDSCPSDCESGISGTEEDEQNEHNNSHNGMIKLHQDDKIFEIIRNKFVSSSSCYGFSGEVETIYKNGYSGIMNQVKYRSFCLYSRGMQINRSNANVKYAWYGGGSKDELNTILSNGFSLPPDSGIYGSGLYLSPVDHPIESVQSAAAADGDGLRHMLLCRVILGNTEVIAAGSTQHRPGSEEFDSGIDNSASPKKYIIWNGNINTHILPEFIVSVRVSSGCQKISQPALRVPKSDWMPFASLIKDVSKFLPSDAVDLISKHHCEFRKQKITRVEMIRRVRCIAGDKLLIKIIKSFRAKLTSKHLGRAAATAAYTN